MKNLKQILFGATIAFGTLTLMLSSCGKDECEDVICYNNAPCDGGNCQCGPGYTGSQCENRLADQWNGTYMASDTDNAGVVYPYECVMESSDGDDNIINITNFGGIDQNTSLSVTQNTDDIYNFYEVGPVTYQGYTLTNLNGNISWDANDKRIIRVDYQLNDGSGSRNVMGTWTEK